MSKFKFKKKKFFKSGLALCGEKKIYEKIYTQIDVDAAADNYTYKWKVLDLWNTIDNIV